MVTLKKIYTCCALLLCAPTALFSFNDTYTIVGVQVKGSDEKFAVFVSTDLTISNLYDKALSKCRPYQGDIENVLLYTKNQSNNGMMVVNKNKFYEKQLELYSASKDEAKKIDEEIHNSLNNIANKAENGGFKEKYSVKGEDLEKACEAWDKEEEPTGIDLPQGEFSNVYENTSSVNNKILIIHATKTDPHYEVVEKKCLAIQIVNGKKFALLEEKGLSITIQDLKQKIQTKKGIPVEQQRFIFKGQQLEDVRKLEDYGIELHQTICLVDRGKRSNNQNFNDEQKSNYLDNTDDEDDSAEEVTLGKVALFYVGAVAIIAGIEAISRKKEEKQGDHSNKKEKKPHSKKQKA